MGAHRNQGTRKSALDREAGALVLLFFIPLCSLRLRLQRSPAFQAFLLYALHHPFDATCLPANIGHAANASVGLP